MSTPTVKYVQPNLYISTINIKMAEITRKMSGNITFVDKQKINDIVTKVNDLKGSINTLKTKISNNKNIGDSYFENVLTQLESCYQLIMVNVIEVPVDNSEIQNLKDIINDIPAFPAGFLDNWSSARANANKVARIPDNLPATLSSANWTTTYTAAAKIPTAFTSTIFTNMQTNSNKVASCGSSLPSTLTSANWTSTYTSAAKIPSTFTADWATITTNSQKVVAVPDALSNTLSSANWTSILNTVSSIPAGFFTDWNKMSYITKEELTEALSVSLKKDR
jgi:hypothetical protein